MRRSIAPFLIPLAAIALMSLPPAAGAQDLRALLRPAASLTSPPAGDPHAFTDAPVPSAGVDRVAPAERAGGAGDAGPMNSTPFSGSTSTVLTGSEMARALDDTAPGRDPTAAAQSRD